MRAVLYALTATLVLATTLYLIGRCSRLLDCVRLCLVELLRQVAWHLMLRVSRCWRAQYPIWP